jgi:hypothetical protein
MMENISIPIIGFWFFGVQTLGLYFTSTNKIPLNKKLLEDKEEVKKNLIFSSLLLIPFHIWCFVLQILAPQRFHFFYFFIFRVLIVEFFFDHHKERILFYFSFIFFLFTKKMSDFSNFFEFGNEFENNILGLILLSALFVLQRFRKKYLKKLILPSYISVGMTSLLMLPLVFILFLFVHFIVLKIGTNKNVG